VKDLGIALERVEHALERFGLLLQHDVELPSVTSLVAGKPIRGSWWGHPLGHAIYDLIGELEQRSGKLATKIIDAKVTYVHPRLWPAFLSLVQHDTSARVAGLPASAAALFAVVDCHAVLRADAPEIPRELVGAPRELTKAIRALEARLLVHSDSLHTDTGAHVKLLRTWRRWCSDHAVRIAEIPVTAAKMELDSAVEALRAGGLRRPKTPW